MKKHDEPEMRKLYSNWLESGKSKAAFAAEQHLVAATFYYWIKKFQRQDLLSPPAAPRGGFQLLPLDHPSCPREVLLRINYPSGITIELYEAVDPSFLRTLTA